MADAPQSMSESTPLISKSGCNEENIDVRKFSSNGTFATGRSDDDVGDIEEGEITDPATGDRDEEIVQTKKHLKYIIPAVSIGILLSAVDQTIIVSSYGRIGTELGALNATSWIATSYFLTLSAFQPLYGKLSDIFGRKAALLFSYVVFGSGCLFCGLARNIKDLIAARAFAGIGGGGMTTVVTVLLNDIVPLRERGTWQGITNIIFAVGSGFGAPLGGILSDFIGWRWVFLCQVPLCVLAFFSVSVVLHLPSKDKSHWKEKVRRVDVLGAVVLISAVFSFLLGLDRGSNVAWSDKESLVPLGLSVPLFVAFAIVEMKVAAEPFAPGRVIFEHSLIFCYICNFFSFGAYITQLFYIPLFFQVIDEYSGTQAGIRLLPAVISALCGSLFGGVMMQKTGKYYKLTVVGHLMLGFGTLPLYLCSGLITNNAYGIAIGLAMSAFGLGISATTTLTCLIANAGPDDQAVAIACSYLYRCLGSVVGLSLGSTVVQQCLRRDLRASLGDGQDADKIVQGVRQSLDFIETLPPNIRAVIQSSYGNSICSGYLIVMAASGLALLSSFFIREKKLDR